MTVDTSSRTGPIPEAYSGLTAEWPLRPIRSKKSYRAATKIADKLAVRNDLTKDQEDFLEVLSLLIEAYENVHHQMDLSDLGPVEMLKFLLEEHGLSGSDLGRVLGGPRQLGSAILRGERQLSKAHIRTLAEHFNVEAGLFLQGEKPMASGQGRTRGRSMQEAEGAGNVSRAASKAPGRVKAAKMGPRAGSVKRQRAGSRSR